MQYNTDMFAGRVSEPVLGVPFAPSVTGLLIVGSAAKPKFPPAASVAPVVTHS